MIINNEDAQRLQRELLNELDVDTSQVDNGSVSVEVAGDWAVITWKGRATMPAAEFEEFFNQSRIRADSSS